MEKMLLKPMEAAEVLNLGRTKVYALISSGRLPTIRVDGSIRVPVESIRAWIAERLPAPTPDRGR